MLSGGIDIFKQYLIKNEIFRAFFADSVEKLDD